MLTGFSPLVSDWFLGKFGSASEPQLQGWPAIQAGRDVLIAAPTGSGKTLAAFLVCLDKLITQGASGELPDEVQVIYLSPLRALSNDIQKNLQEPLAALAALAAARGLPWPNIRVGVRTGDTPAHVRAAQMKKPPHLLITTPESLYLLLTSDKGRERLRTVKTVIVDEIHALAKDKRGSHLALSLERLSALCPERPARIGLSATQRPIEQIARFLVGTHRVAADGTPDCTIVDTGSRRHMDLSIVVPHATELQALTPTEQWAQTHEQIAELVKTHQSTLIFVNARAMVERFTHELEARLGPGMVAAHHGSMSREARFQSEDALKNHRVRAVVATASLEMGIDIGSVDLVCQVGTPRAFHTTLQRVGRSGHWRGATPKGRLFPTTRDELLECASIIRGIRTGKLEHTEIPLWPLDILAQQIVAETSCRAWGEEELFKLVQGAWPYGQLPKAEWDKLLAMLSEGVASARGRSLAHVHRDEVNGELKGRRHARLTALLGGGAIPDVSTFSVIAEPEGVAVGTLAEEFAVETGIGDVFLLGNTSWRIRQISTGVIRVENAQGAPPTIPFWEGDLPGRSIELSDEVGLLRSALEPLVQDAPDEARALLETECGLGPEASVQAVAYLAASLAALGVLPTQTTLVAERFFDEGGGMQLVIHAPFGLRINRAFGLALRKCFCRSFDFELQAAATDNGILLSLGPQHSFPLDSVFQFLSVGMLEEALTQAALRSPLFGARWRWNATRALALKRSEHGKRIAPQVIRMRSEDLLAACFPQAAQCQEHQNGPLEVPDHPLVQETMRDCLTEAMDLAGLTALVTRINGGQLRLVARDTVEASPLSHEILFSHPHGYLDDAPAEERRARAVQTRRTLDPKDARVTLDPQAIAMVQEQAWPDPRDPDEMHDALLTLCVLPESRVLPSWRPLLEALETRKRVIRLELPHGVKAWAAAERAALVDAAIPGCTWARAPLALRKASDTEPLEREPSLLRVVRGWVEHTGPTTAVQLQGWLGAKKADVDFALGGLESQGLVLQGHYSPGERELEWCERALLARIHRLTLGKLRQEIEPCSGGDFMRFLLRHQHVNPGSQLQGREGLLEVLGQLQGLSVPAAAWEREVLPSRLRGYKPEWLDELCQQGEIVWGRFHAARGEGEPRRGVTRAAPIGLALRSDAGWLLSQREAALPALSELAMSLKSQLEQRGALFFRELVQHCKKPADELEPGLWELVAAGEVTSDGFAGLRALLDGAKETRANQPHPLHRGGRWSLLRPALEAEGEALTEGAALEARVALLLRRYGVVFRDLVGREPHLPPWRELLRVFRRLEDRGDVRGGRFVAGFAGEQFALPGAVETLRAVRRIPRTVPEEVTLAAADPLNLTGLLTSARVAATSSQGVLFRDGVPVLGPVAEAG